MQTSNPLPRIVAALFIALAIAVSGCNIVKEKVEKPILLETSDAPEEALVSQIQNLAQVNSLRAKMYLKFEDNSYAELGLAEKYRTADGVVLVQRPASILLEVKVPVISTDVAKLASDGNKFSVAILNDGGSGKYKKFLRGSNAADYSVLKKQVNELENGGKELKKNVNAFSNLRPQHFTDALLVRPIDRSRFEYLQSTIVLEEFDLKASKKSPLRWVLRGYYLFDEIERLDDGRRRITRRFWFDRVGGVRLARQQIFDAAGEIESDIVYGTEGQLTENGEYRLPLMVDVTRPKERYRMSLRYQSPGDVMIGREFPEAAFTLSNDWGLVEVDLDVELEEFLNGGSNANDQKKENTSVGKEGN